MAKKSETLRQREKAQRDLLELKKMQRGEIEIKSDDDKKITPDTVSEKAENFFFYHKYKLIVIVAALIALAIILYSTFTKPKYDATLTIYCYEYVDEGDVGRIGDWINEYYPDVNSNGSTDVLTTDCSFASDTDLAETVQNRQLKIQSILTESDALLFILDSDSLKYLNGISEDITLFTEDNIIELPESFYEYLGENRSSLPSGKTRYLCLRTVDGTAIEGSAAENYKAAREVLEKIRSGQADVSL